MCWPAAPVDGDGGPEQNHADDLEQKLLGPERDKDRTLPVAAVQVDFGWRGHAGGLLGRVWIGGAEATPGNSTEQIC